MVAGLDDGDVSDELITAFRLLRASTELLAEITSDDDVVALEDASEEE